MFKYKQYLTESYYLANKSRASKQPVSMSIHPDDMSSLLHGPSLAENSENDLQHQQLDHSDNIDGEYRSSDPLMYLKYIFLFNPLTHIYNI